jgi:hypothetical protein
MPLAKKVHLADILIDGTLPRQDVMKTIRGAFIDILKHA